MKIADQVVNTHVQDELKHVQKILSLIKETASPDDIQYLINVLKHVKAMLKLESASQASKKGQ